MTVYPTTRRSYEMEPRSMRDPRSLFWLRSRDASVWSESRRLIDFSSGIFVANTGHAPLPVMEAIVAYLENGGCLHTYVHPNDQREAFLRALLSALPLVNSEKVLLASSGTEVTEAAIRLMRLYGKRNGCRDAIVSIEGAMHGRTLGARILQNGSGAELGVPPEESGFYQLPFPFDVGDSGAEVSDALAKIHVADPICGIILEAYQGWSARFYPLPYITALVEWAHRHDVLICVDEIQSALGRTGRMLACEYYGIVPDLLCLGKGLAAGLPLSALVGRAEVLDLPGPGEMSSTHGGNPLSCVAGTANLRMLLGETPECENLIENSRELGGAVVQPALETLRGECPIVSEVNWGVGLLAGIVFDSVDVADAVCSRAYRTGLLVVHTGRESVKIGPPLSIREEELSEGMLLLHKAVRWVMERS